MSDFSNHIVNQRFKEIYNTLIQNKLIRGKTELAKSIGTYNHVVNNILQGKRNLTLNQLLALFEIYHINANYIFGKSNDMFQEGYDALGVIPNHRKDELQFEPKANITLIPKHAMAGPALDLMEQENWETLPKFSLPNMQGDLIAIEISGDSMQPTLTNGDIVICEPLEQSMIRDNHVYIVVTDSVVAKRVQKVKQDNQISHLRLISDNDAVYKPYEVELEDIRQMLKVKCRLTDYAIG